MESLKGIARNAVEPVLGAAFIAFWLFAEVRRIRSADLAGVLDWCIPFVLIGIAIAVSRLLPWVALTATGVFLTAQLTFEGQRFNQNSWPAYLGLLFVGVVIGASPRRLARIIALPLFCVYGFVIAQLVLGLSIQISIVAIVVAVASWFIGFGIRAQRARIRSEIERRAVEADLAVSELELRVASERDRIAQDVHDIMAHSLSVMVAQADGARYLGDKRPESTTKALASIAQSARESLVEVRMLIDSLGPEPDGHSHPTLNDLEALVERMRSAGLSIAENVFGDSGNLTPGQQMAVYRIVQESLTNALKHGGPAAEAQIVFDWRGPGLALTVSSRGNGGIASTGSTTRGLRGMQERARLAGGWLAAGPDDDEPGRFVVTTFIPLADVSSSGAAS